MRRSRLAQFDDQFRARWGDCLAGVDEAGRGPLAGPVVAACVALPPDASLRGVRDSKELTANEREAALERIRAVAIATGVGIASVAEVDAFNIRMATLLAMRRAVEALGIVPRGLLIDGKDTILVPDVPCEAVVDGDAKSLSVAAASILAKVTRDRMMDECAAEYPVYGFEENKGYGTPDHLEALRAHGPCELHRKSFRPVRELLCVQEVIELF
ncbi:MAG TPA: ribonuclease HII [Candidatus Eisenbacteria bacterium]|nr:ribonuclease HII [Candidatus Eisenbacteria bacterium]